MRILLANPRGFCAGVDRAIKIVEHAIEIYGIPIYVRHEVVHNSYIVKSLKERGTIFIECIDEVPDGSILIFSAHGVSQAVRIAAKNRNLTVFDATCPLVTKIHMEVARASRKGIEVILIGHSSSHPEEEGIIGQYSNLSGGIYLVRSIKDVWDLKVKNSNSLCLITKTTLSVDDTLEIIYELKSRFPRITYSRKNNICYATTNRQNAVRNIAINSDAILVVGSNNSSNANRLSELAIKIGKKAYLIEDDRDIKESWIKGVNTIGITAGASTPDILVNKVVTRLQSLGAQVIEEVKGYKENVVFELPRDLRIPIKLLD